MIRLDHPEHFAPSEQFALSVLLDLSRLLVVADEFADVVTISVTDRTSGGLAEPSTLEADRWGIRVRQGSVELPRTLLQFTSDIVGAAAEQRSDARDRFDRVPPTANPLVAAEAWDRPLVSTIAGELRAATREAAGRRPFRTVAPWPDGRPWAAAITHDVDVVTGWPAFTLMRVGELVRRGELSRAATVVAAAAARVGRNPVRQGIDNVLDVERDAGVLSTWFFLTGSPSLATWRRGDITYAIESRAARSIVDAVRDAGGEVGLHGSFDAFTEGASFERERRRLSAVGGRVEGVRQHYLRMRPGQTHHAMAAAGLLYDASHGFSDRNGFRLGVADIVPAWNEHAGQTDDLELVPLMWMDRVLSKHQRVESPGALVESAMETAERCRVVEGLWVGLWHPNMTTPLGFPGATEAYRQIVERLCEMGPYIATLTGIVEWCRARRLLRARRVGVDGRVELDCRGVNGYRFVVRDEMGRSL